MGAYHAAAASNAANSHLEKVVTSAMSQMRLKELDANLLVVLDALLIETSVSKAAERLGRSPSAISHALANLRAVLKDELFVRAGQRLVPTARAEQIAPTVHVIVSGIESLVRPPAEFDPERAALSFRIALAPGAEMALLPTIAEMTRESTQFKIDIVGLDDAQIGEQLRDARAHLVVLDHPLDSELPDLSGLEGAPQDLVAVKRASAGGEAHDLAAPDWVLQNDNFVKNIAATAPDDEQPVLQVHPVTSFASALLLTMTSDAVAVVPAAMAKAAGEAIDLKQVDLPVKPPVLRPHIIWHRSHEHDEAHRWLRQRLADEYFSDKP